MKINLPFPNRLKRFNVLNFRFPALCLVLCSIVFMVGCRRPSRVKVEQTSPVLSCENLTEDIALAQTDISLPLGLIKYQVDNASHNHGQYVVDYYGSFTPLAMRDFYELDMERLGWRLLTKFAVSGEQHLLLFDKPQSWCIISIAPCSSIPNATSKTTIFVGSKDCGS